MKEENVGAFAVGILRRCLNLARRTDLHLVLVRDGPLKPCIELLLLAHPELKEHMHIPGYISEDLLPSYYAVADIFVFPTHGDV